jgi:hypothetical protein
MSSRVGLNVQSVIHGAAEPLLAPEIMFGRPNRYVAEEELNLVQSAARQVAQAGQPVVDRCSASLLVPAAAATFRTTSQSTLAVIPSPQTQLTF